MGCIPGEVVYLRAFCCGGPGAGYPGRCTGGLRLLREGRPVQHPGRESGARSSKERRYAPLLFVPVIPPPVPRSTLSALDGAASPGFSRASCRHEAQNAGDGRIERRAPPRGRKGEPGAPQAEEPPNVPSRGITAGPRQATLLEDVWEPEEAFPVHAGALNGGREHRWGTLPLALKIQASARGRAARS